VHSLLSAYFPIQVSDVVNVEQVTMTALAHVKVPSVLAVAGAVQGPF